MDFLEDHCLKVNRGDKEAAFKGKDEEPIGLAFDFVYLPIDFKYATNSFCLVSLSLTFSHWMIVFMLCRSRMNKGYAFVNFTKPQAARKFRNTASRLKWDMFQSNKIREVVSARLQVWSHTH